MLMLFLLILSLKWDLRTATPRSRVWYI